MNKKIFSALMVMLISISLLAQEQNEGIVFFEGSFEEALAEAQKQDKSLFVDFYAVWCGPCKRMEKNVFTQKVVGDYFNERFINLQLDAEKPENSEVVEKFKVDAFPTLGFFDNEGKAISIVIGGMDVSSLLQAAKIAVGEIIGFEQLYKMHKEDPNNMSIQQDLLMQSPNFLSAQQGLSADRWLARLVKLYQSYIDKKMGPDLINKQDYRIISVLSGNSAKEKEEMVHFMNSNLEAWREAVGDAPAYYIIEHNDNMIETLAKNGNEEYKVHLQKMQDEYKEAYSIIESEGISPYERSKVYYDGLYSLYKDKDVEKYTSFIDSYLKLLGEEATPNDYGKAAQDLYYAAGEKLNNEMHMMAISWLQTALDFQTAPLMEKINYLVMIGDSYRKMKDYDQAELYYNQGYMESLQMTDMESVQQMIQGSIFMKLAEIDLLKK